MVPGLLTWSTFLVSIVASYFSPVWVAFFIILFDVFWLFKAVNIALHLVYTHRKLQLHGAYDWRLRLEGLGDLPKFIRTLEQQTAIAPTRVAREDLEDEITRLRRLKAGGGAPDYHTLFHIVLLPTVKEPLEVLRTSIESYRRSDFPLSRIMIVLACEERSGQAASQIADRLRKEFGSAFGHFLVTVHPDGIAGEARTKGANITYAARMAAEMVKGQEIKPESVLVSAFDADTVVKPGYFSQLSYTYLTTPDRTRASYQPVPVYNNNVWEAPAVNRLVAINSSFWQMVESSRPDRLVTFSSHSMSLSALLDVNFWPVDVVSEDSQIFWRCFLKYHGEYRTIPLFSVVSLDAVVLDSYMASLVGQYRQNRRWAWGIENFPYLLTGMAKDPLIPRWKKYLYGYRLLEGHYFWATAALLIAFLGWLPLLLGMGRIENQVLALNLPKVTGNIMTLATLFLILNVALYFNILPERPRHHSKWKFLGMFLQWLLIPISQIFFAALPAIDAQTRLMLGRHMEFWVTPKVRKEPSQPMLPFNSQRL
ncbi:MAG: hypothetical protein A2722_01380 [Candidatus Doudnabacteria bacterium RIFCSPHIGHO2_01_FULL_50_11]|uniref:Glycosyltransferase 2-like domain-containing protein n=1 Tax=Candidatus Doudnabacteria bacterium RIFCSPHIGHO2_01_FULL_50_11 TaxID=1817828 RepID=A0A1F5PHB0_9BACT|nr:MAG: hypothetical protein A2722_01380 [Candidatus Doudnabacteria bacterium RIFCSPHIGHO2_01_FULL_50_11]